MIKHNWLDFLCWISTNLGAFVQLKASSAPVNISKLIFVKWPQLIVVEFSYINILTVLLVLYNINGSANIILCAVNCKKHCCCRNSLTACYLHSYSYLDSYKYHTTICYIIRLHVNVSNFYFYAHNICSINRR